MYEIETARLRMRPWAFEDAADLRRMYTDPRVYQYLPGPGAATEEEQVERIQRHLSGTWAQYDHGMMSVFLKDGGAFAGSCGLLHWDLDGAEETEVAYGLVPEFWHQGYAIEAARALAEDGFTRLGRERLISLVHPENTASIGVALRNGMQLERTTKLFEMPVNVYVRNRDG